MKHIAIFQSSLKAYRVPLFRALNSLPEWQVTVLHGPTRSSPGEGTFELSFPLRSANVGPLTWQQEATGALEEIKPDAVVVGANPWILSNHRVLRWCADRGVPVFLWGLGFAPGPRTGGLRVIRAVGRRLLKKLLAGASGVLAYSEHAAAVYRECSPHSLPVHVIGNASVENLTVQRSSPMATDRRLLFVGRLTPPKRVGVLIEALGLPEADPSWELDIVGTGSEEVALRELAEKQNTKSVRFRGHQEPAEVRRLMGNAHFLVLPGRGGLVVQEALACGLPVIALSGGQGGGDGTIEDFLDSTIAGELVHGRSANALCEALAAGFENENWHDRQRAAFEVSSRDGGLSGVVERFSQAVESALA